MQQTRLGSLIESLLNIAIGYVVALLSQLMIFPLFDIHVPLSTNLWIGAWFYPHQPGAQLHHPPLVQCKTALGGAGHGTRGFVNRGKKSTLKIRQPAHQIAHQSAPKRKTVCGSIKLFIASAHWVIA